VERGMLRVGKKNVIVEGRDTEVNGKKKSWGRGDKGSFFAYIVSENGKYWSFRQRHALKIKKKHAQRQISRCFSIPLVKQLGIFITFIS
jgi:hypothetical protein